MNVTGQTIDFAKSFLGNPQGKFGIHQLGLGYLFFSDKSLMATQLPAYYDQNSFTENTFAISASFDIGRWFRSFDSSSHITDRDICGHNLR